MRTKREFSWNQKKIKKNDKITWKEYYLQQDFLITINEVNRYQAGMIHKTHQIKVSPNASLPRLLKQSKEE